MVGFPEHQDVTSRSFQEQGVKVTQEQTLSPETQEATQEQAAQLGG